MQELITAWSALRDGGPMVYPLLFLGVIAVLPLIMQGFTGGTAFGGQLIEPKSMTELRELVEKPALLLL